VVLNEEAFDFARLKVVVFDVDGTLYRQGPVRRAMCLRLLGETLRRPAAGWQAVRTLRAYRRAQEDLRTHHGGDIAGEQIRLTCARVGSNPPMVAACVERWMQQEPLKFLAANAWSGLTAFLGVCRARGLRLAALSDYPAAAKLSALEIAQYFDVILSAQSPDVDRFKPDPRGLQVVLESMDVSPHECLYVGDRAEVDAAAAAAAGIRCVIVSRRAKSAASGYTTVTSYTELQHRLFGNAHVPHRGVVIPSES